MKQHLRILGFILLIIAIVCWIATPIVAFLNWDNTTKATWVSLLFVVGEVAFILSISILGKEVWNKIKLIFKRFFKAKEHE